MKAKSKGKELNKGVKTVKKEYTVCNDPLSTEFHKNNMKKVFDNWQPPDFTQIKSQMDASLKESEKSRERIMPKITLSDPLIIEIQNLIDQEEEIIRLDEEELIEVLEIVDGRKIPDWRN